MKKISMLLLLLSCLPGAVSLAEARPVSYSGGWMVMQMNDSENNSLSVDYSPTAFYSLGYYVDYWREEEWTFNSLRLNWLAKRWNGEDLQANFYLTTALGAASSDFREFDGEIEPAGMAGLEFDAENRRLYVSYENSWTDAGVIDESFRQKARVGVAPYIAEYGGLHTWIMLQVDHRPHSEDTLAWTPMLRLFKGDALVEVGISDSKDVMFNFTYQF